MPFTYINGSLQYDTTYDWVKKKPRTCEMYLLWNKQTKKTVHLLYLRNEAILFIVGYKLNTSKDQKLR